MLAKKNRKNPTVGEKEFWKLLSYKKLGYKFTKQKPSGRFILDFYCSDLLLDIEIDGDSHNKKQNYDQGRDLYLEQRAIKTIRFRNEDVLNNIEKVRKELINVINLRKQMF